MVSSAMLHSKNHVFPLSLSLSFCLDSLYLRGKDKDSCIQSKKKEAVQGADEE